MPILFSFILALIVTIALIPLLISVAIKTGLYDQPDARKVHAQPIPRMGGVAMAVGALVPVLIYGTADTFAWSFLAGATIIVAFGLLDDLVDLNFKIKFAAQIGAALIVVLYGGLRITRLGSLLPGDMVLMEGVGIFLAVVAIVGVTNALNLADGLDGLAGGISLLMLLCMAILPGWTIICSLSSPPRPWPDPSSASSGTTPIRLSCSWGTQAASFWDSQPSACPYL